MTPIPLTHFIIEGITGCTNEAARSANKAPRNIHSCFLNSCFAVLVTSSTPASLAKGIATLLVFFS